MKKWIISLFMATGFACTPAKSVYIPPSDAGQTEKDFGMPDTGAFVDIGQKDPGQADIGDVNDATDNGVPDVRDVETGEGLPVIQCQADDDCGKLAGWGDTQCLKPVCIKSGICSLVPVNEGAACKIDDACLTNTICKQGTCTGNKVDCDDDNPCTTDHCVSATGCAHDANNRSCDDHNDCTTQDFCKQGTCHGFNNQCVCLKDDDCRKFDDKNKCNGSLVCDKGQCVVDPATIVRCENLTTGQPCQELVCNPETGQCEQQAKPDGTGCDDKNVCTREDICLHGKCVGVKPMDCDDKDACTRDFCDPEKGCMHKALEGTSCDDKDVCTTGDTCTVNGCQGERIPGCGCKSDKECKVSFLRNGYSLCDATVSCNEQHFCVVKALSPPVACQASVVRSCQQYTCDPKTGGCVWLNLPDGRGCNYGDGKCKAGNCGFN